TSLPEETNMHVIVSIGALAAASAATAADLDPRIAVPTTLAGPGVLAELQDGAKPQDAKAPDGKAAEAAPKPEISFWNGWKRNVDLGLNGASGNSENLSVRGLVGAERKSETLETKANIQYVYATDDGDKSKSRGEANLFNNWLFSKDSRWGW